MRWFVITTTILFLLICSLQAQVHDTSTKDLSSEAFSSGIVYEGGNGTSFSDAIIIKGAPNSEIGVPAEYRLLRKKYPGYRMFKQRTLSGDGKQYDIIEIKNAQGDTITIYFDITNFYGK